MCSRTEILTGGYTTQRTFKNFSGFFVAVSGLHGMKTEAQLQGIKRIWRREFHLFFSVTIIAQKEADRMCFLEETFILLPLVSRN
jgi:hypothetical protein